MNILYLLTADLNIGGAQKDILIFARHFIKKGHKITVACKKGDLKEDLVKSGARHYDIDFHFRSPAQFFKGVGLLRSIIENEKIDILAPQSIRTSIAAFFANRTHKKPTITTIHNVGSWFYTIPAGLILNRTSKFVIFESEYERQRLVRFGLDRHRSVVVHSGIELSEFSPRPKDREFFKEINLSPDDIVVGTVARLSEEKGQIYLIEAMAEVIKTIPRAKLIFVGDGPLLGSHKSQVTSHKLEDKILFLGEKRDIPRYLSLMDLFVLSSRRESFPLSAREAMAMGKPVVATKVGGCSEVIKDGQTGILVAPADSRALAAAIAGLLNDKAKMRRMGETARLRALNLFNQNRWLDTNEELMLYFYKNNSKKIPKRILRNLFSSLFYSLFKGLRQQRGIRVLNYHRVSDVRPYERLCVKTNEFKKQMEYLYKNNYRVIGIDEMVGYLSKSAGRRLNNLQDKKVVITFDDGFADNYANAYPVLKEYGFAATIFLTVNSIGERDFLNWGQIDEMAHNSISFGAHTLRHPELTGIGQEEAKSEINGSKEAIEAKGLRCDYFCYPRGDFNQPIKALVREAGFRAACSIKPGANLSGQDLFALRRTEVSGFDSPFDFKKKLAGAFDWMHRLVQNYKIHSPQSKINVLYIIWSLGLGGAEQVVINLAKGLDKKRFRPIVCCLNEKGEFADELEKEGIQVLALHKKGKFDIAIIKKIIAVIKANHIRIVHTHLWGANFWGRLAAILCRIPVIASEHNEDSWKPRLFLYADKILSLFTDRIIAVSNRVKHFYVHRAGIHPDKITVVYNGIEANRFGATGDISLKKKELGIKDEELVLGVIGRLVPQKGHIYFLRALNELSKRQSLRGLIIGSGPLDRELKDAAQAIGLNGKVIFTGLRQDIPQLLNLVDVLVMPSLREGLPIIALEAMAAGVPVVATNVGGNPEVIIDGETGLLVQPRNAEALKNAINRLITDKDYSRTLVKKARFRIESFFNVMRMVSDTEKIYEENER